MCGTRETGAGKCARWPVSRVLSTEPPRTIEVLRRMAIHLGRPLPDASRDQPGRRSGNAPGRHAAVPSLFGLAPGGVYRAASVAGRAVRSYRTLSPLPAGLTAGRRFAFCGTFPRVAPAGRYPAPCFRGARTFLPPARGPESGHPAIWPSIPRAMIFAVQRKSANGSRGATRGRDHASGPRSNAAIRRVCSRSQQAPRAVGWKWRWNAVTAACSPPGPSVSYP